MDQTVPSPVGLDIVRARRAELRETIDALERSLAAPISGREVVWGEVVHDALSLLATEFSAHVEVTEGPGGLHQAILGGDLRLANAVDALTAEHGRIAEDLALLIADSQPPVAPAQAPVLRERANHLLGELVRHRQRGADLIYEAFHSDVGGAD